MNEKKDGPQAKRKKKEGRVTTRPHSCGRGRREKKRRNHKKIRSPPPHQFQKKNHQPLRLRLRFLLRSTLENHFHAASLRHLVCLFFFLSAFDQIRQSSSRWMAIKEKRDTEDTITSTSPLKTKNNRLSSRFFFTEFRSVSNHFFDFLETLTHRIETNPSQTLQQSRTR